ncbi:MAG: hypothetical protein ACRDTE_00295 [Pseudonocardiaceae bacterium]
MGVGQALTPFFARVIEEVGCAGGSVLYVGDLFIHAHDHLLRTGLAEVTDPDPPAPSRLRTAARVYQAAFHDLAHHAHLTA